MSTYPDIRELLPHDSPMILLDSVVEVRDAGLSVHACDDAAPHPEGTGPERIAAARLQRDLVARPQHRRERRPHAPRAGRVAAALDDGGVGSRYASVFWSVLGATSRVVRIFRWEHS